MTEKSGKTAGALKPGCYIYGNKGAVWSGKVHIAVSGKSETLCGTPMLANNHARIEGVESPGCEKCIKLHEEL